MCLIMDLRIPINIKERIDIIVKYQNINLIKEICNYMGWNKDVESKLIKELVC